MFRKKKYSDELLVNAIKTGGKEEDDAITYLIKNEYGKIENLIIKRNGSVADAEDIFQEAISVLIMNIRNGTFKGESSIATYLFAICKSMWFKRFKKYIRETDYQTNMIAYDVDESTPEIEILEDEQKALLNELFGRLRENCKELLLWWGSSYSMAEIADKLNFSNAQVAMNKKNKCLSQLRNLMDQDPKVQMLVKELGL